MPLRLLTLLFNRASSGIAPPNSAAPCSSDRLRSSELARSTESQKPLLLYAPKSRKVDDKSRHSKSVNSERGSAREGARERESARARSKEEVAGRGGVSVCVSE